MTSRPLFVLAIVGASACTDDVPVLRIATTATVLVDLAPPEEDVPADLAHYRWEVADAPPGAFAPAPTEVTPTIVIQPARRGIYVYDRWFIGGATEQLSYHVVVTVYGAAPMAHITGPTMAAVGTAATFDGSSSLNPEHRTLTFQWRLATRPEGSAAVLADVESETLSFAADVAGEYTIELRAFDGELWSQPSRTTLVAY